MVATGEHFGNDEAAPGHAVCYQPPRYVGDLSRKDAPSPSKTYDIPNAAGYRCPEFARFSNYRCDPIAYNPRLVGCDKSNAPQRKGPPVLRLGGVQRPYRPYGLHSKR